MPTDPTSWCTTSAGWRARSPPSERYRFVGPCIDPRREQPGDWTPPPGDGRLALVAFGTSYTDRVDLYRNTIDGMDGTGWRLVIATGRVAHWLRPPANVPESRTNWRGIAISVAAPAFWTVVFYLVTRVFWHLP